MINDINCWQVNSNPAASPKKKRCIWKKGEDELEKAATTSTGTRSAVNTTRSQELWTRILTSIGLSNCEPTVPCAFYSWWQLSLAAIELVALARALARALTQALAPCQIQAVPVWAERPQFIQLQHMDSHAIITIQCQLVKSSVFKPIITY